jgi:protocatechuate 3,4-dioxygenase beta subunit
MKLKSLGIAVVLSLLLIGLIIYVVRERGVKPDATPAPTPVAARAPVPAPAPAAARAVAPRAAEVKAEPAAAVAPRQGPAIVGLVTDGKSGQPIPRAVVRARGSKLQASTGEDGAYRLTGMSAGEHYLVAVADGYAEEHARARLGADEEFIQDFHLEAAIDLLVTVLNQERKPLEGVEITPCQPNGDYVRGEEYTRLTDREGKATLTGIGRLRQQQVNARKEGFREVWTKDYRVDPDQDRAELTIVMEPRLEGDAVVVGKVTGPDGLPLRGVHVQWIHPHGQQKGRVVADTARDGTYRLEFPRAGDWCAICAHGEGFAPYLREGVKPGNAAQPAKVDISLRPGHWLEGRVTDEDGRPVAAARVVALPTIYNLRNTPLHPGIASEGRTDDQGRFSLTDLSATTTALQIEGPSGVEWGNNFHPQVEVDRKVALQILRWGQIRGRVLDRESGEPIQVFGIKLSKGVGSRHHVLQLDSSIQYAYYDYQRTDPGEFFNSPEGSFVLKKLDQGPIEFEVEAEGYIPKWVSDAQAESEERAQVHEVRITRGRFIEGTVVDAESGAPLSEARIDFGAWEEGDLAWDEGAFRKMVDRQEVTTGADGLFRVREGEPGTLFVRRSGYARLALPPRAWKRLLDASGRLRVALSAGVTLSGVLYEDGVPSKRGFLVLFSRRGAGGDESREWIGNLDRDAQGRFRAEDLAPGDYYLEHWRETPGGRTAGLSIQRPVHLDGGKEGVLDFGADLGPLSFQGRLLAPNGKPLPRARLTLRPDFEWAYTELAATCDADHDGRFHFLGLRPGTYRVEAANRTGKKTALAPIEIEADLERDLVIAAGN